MSAIEGDDAASGAQDVRAPFDADRTRASFCFLCSYQAGPECEQYHHLSSLIRSTRGKLPTRDVARLVKEYYDDEIRPFNSELKHRPWSVLAIEQHILMHGEDRSVFQLNENLNALFVNIQSLRDACWTDDGYGQVTPNLPRISQMERLIKTHQSLSATRLCKEAQPL